MEKLLYETITKLKDILYKIADENIEKEDDKINFIMNCVINFTGNICANNTKGGS